MRALTATLGRLRAGAREVAAEDAFGRAAARADYRSVFGVLATVRIVLGNLSSSSVSFLAGLQVDALVRKRAS